MFYGPRKRWMIFVPKHDENTLHLLGELTRKFAGIPYGYGGPIPRRIDTVEIVCSQDRVERMHEVLVGLGLHEALILEHDDRVTSK